jgi:hypothetical protein
MGMTTPAGAKARKGEDFVAAFQSCSARGWIPPLNVSAFNICTCFLNKMAPINMVRENGSWTTLYNKKKKWSMLCENDPTKMTKNDENVP